MPYCPNCRTEYREGFTTCSDCDVPLVHELAPEVPCPDGEMVPIFVARDSMEAEIVKGILESVGIGCYVTPDPTRYSRLIGIVVDSLHQQSVMVLESDADRARAAIEQAMEAGEQEPRESD